MIFITLIFWSSCKNSRHLLTSCWNKTIKSTM